MYRNANPQPDEPVLPVPPEWDRRMETVTDCLPQALRAVRHIAGWSQRVAAVKAGVPRSWLSEVENGRRDPSLSGVMRLAAAYELQVLLVPVRPVDGSVPGVRLHLDHEWLASMWELSVATHLAHQPDPREWPYSLITYWGDRRRDADERRERWLRARVNYLERLRELAEELLAKVEHELAEGRD